MVENIGRNNESRLNIKSQDEWFVEVGNKSPDSASLVIRLRLTTPGFNPEGVLYINMESLQKLEELKKSIQEFLKHQKPILKEYRRAQKLAEREFKKVYG